MKEEQIATAAATQTFTISLQVTPEEGRALSAAFALRPADALIALGGALGGKLPAAAKAQPVSPKQGRILPRKDGRVVYATDRAGREYGPFANGSVAARELNLSTTTVNLGLKLQDERCGFRFRLSD